MALPTFLNCLAINELMTFWTFLAKSCYWNSFLLSFQDYLLLFTFFYHYINNGVFIHLKWVITACVQWTKGEGGEFKTEVMKMSHQVQGFVEKQWRHFRWRNSELVFFCETVITLLILTFSNSVFMGHRKDIDRHYMITMTPPGYPRLFDQEHGLTWPQNPKFTPSAPSAPSA